MSERIEFLELDLTEPDERRPPDRSRGSGFVVRRRLALAAAFVLGVVLGAAALDKQQDSAAARAERGEVSLLGVILPDPIDPQRLGYAVQIHNDGPHAVSLHQPRLVVPGYEDPPVAPRGGERTIEPGAWARIPAVAGLPVCPDLPADGEPALAARITTVDGESREVSIPLLDTQHALANDRSSNCQALLHPETAISMWAETSTVTGTTVTVSLRFESWGQRAVDVVDVRPGPGLTIETVQTLPVTIPASGSIAIEVKVLAADCEVRSSGGLLSADVSYGDATTTHELWIEPSLPPQLMADQGCGGQG